MEMDSREQYNRLVNEALAHHQAGRLREAEVIYDKILAEAPDHHDALHLKGAVAFREGRLQESLQLVSRAVQLGPRTASYYNTLGLICQALGDSEQAIGHFKMALGLNPGMSDAHYNLGRLLYRLSWYEEALLHFRQVVASNPGLAEACQDLANTLYQLNRLDEARITYLEAIRLNPGKMDAYHNLGFILHLQGHSQEAIGYLQRAINLKPDFPEAYFNLGNVYSDLMMPEAAMAQYQKAIHLSPDYAEAHHNLGVVFFRQGKLEQAVECYTKALHLKPDYGDACNNMGLVCKELMRVEEAIDYFRRSIQLTPHKVESYRALADLYVRTGAMQEALQWYEKALAVNFQDGLRLEAGLALPPIYQSVADLQHWRDRYVQNLQTLQQEKLKITNPVAEFGGTSFFLAYQGMNDRPVQEAVARLFSSLNIWTEKPPPANDCLRIGIISRYFRKSHTIGKLFLGILERLSREKFDVVVFTVGFAQAVPVEAPHTHFNLPPDQPEYACQQVAAQNLDILFFADVGMDPLTYFLAFNRLAPVQCVTWGHPVTTGIPTMDYYISSSLLETDAALDHYSEQLVLLDSLPTYYYRPVLEKPLPRSHFGLEEGQHLYLCPHSLFKFHPEFDPVLADILRQDPQGVLVLVNCVYRTWEQILMVRFQQTMPDVTSRIKFLYRVPQQEFLALLSQADVMLDTLHFGGGNTTYEALAMGTPIVTLPGDFMRGRVTYACYQKMGITDCIAQSPQEYVALAVRLGTDAEFRTQVKARIEAYSHMLFEDQGAVDELEAFFIRALQTADALQSRLTPTSS